MVAGDTVAERWELVEDPTCDALVELVWPDCVEPELEAFSDLCCDWRALCSDWATAPRALAIARVSPATPGAEPW